MRVDSAAESHVSRALSAGCPLSPGRFHRSRNAVGQDAAFEEGVELDFDELRQVGAGGVFSLGEEGRSVLLH